MSDKNKILLRYQKRMAKVVLSLLLALEAVAGLAQLQAHQEHNDKAADAAHRAHFWQVVAGNEGSRSATPDERLATDFRQILSQSDWDSVLLVFSGNSNAYGGVADALGINPFDDKGRGCKECGPLTPYMRSGLTLVKQGKVSEVIAADQPKPIGGYTFTPFGWSVPVTVFTLWIGGGGVILMVGWALTKSAYGSSERLRDLDWSLSGEGSAANLRIVSISPVALVYVGWGGMANKRLGAKTRERYGYLIDEIDRVDEALEAARSMNPGDPEIDTLTKDRDAVVKELQGLTRSRGANNQRSLQDARDRLGEVKEVLDARRKLQSGG